MALVTLTPSSDVSRSNVNLTGAATAWQALDSSDSSWCQFTGSAPNVIVGMSTTSVASNQRLASLQPFVRLDTGAGLTDTFIYLRRSTDGALSGGGEYKVSLGSLTTFGDWIRTLNWSGAEWTSTDLSHLQLEIADTGAGATLPRVTYAYVLADVRTRATVTAVLPAGTNPGLTRTPIVSWTWTDPDGQPQKKAQVKIFTLAQTVAGGFNPATTTPVIDSGLYSSSQQTYKTPQLANGTYVAYVNAAKDFNSTDWFIAAWVNGSSFTISDSIPAPSSITPASGSTVNTDLPVLGATTALGTLANSPRLKVQWQLARDAGFTASVKTITQPDSAYALAHATTATVDTPNGLTAGAWFLRARVLSEVGDVGAWSSANLITVSHPPTTANLSPSSGNTFDFAGTGVLTFSWQFSDTSPTDFQAAYQVIVERNDTGALVVDTGTVTSASNSVALTIPTALKDIPLRWKVQITDRDAVVGAFSNYQLFYVRDAPTLSGVAATTTTPAPVASWSFTASAGRFEVSYRVTYAYQSTPSVLVYDTGIVSGSGLSATPPHALFMNTDAVQTVVTVTDNTGLSASVTINYTIAYTPPAAPDFTVDSSGYDTLGYAAVIWYTNMIPAASAGPQTVTNPSGGTATTTIGPLPVLAGQTYSALALMAPASGVTPRNTAVAIEWRDASNVVVGTSLSASLLESGAGTVQPTITALAPANAVKANLIVQVFSTAAAEHHNLTQPQFYTGGFTAETPAVDGNFVSWRVYRKLVTDPHWGLVYETSNPNEVEFFDQTAPASIPVQFAVAQVATRFGVTVESTYTALTITITAAAYWLIHPTIAALSVRLLNVKSEQFKSVVERVVIPIIGRGNRVEYGTVFGKSGTLTATIRDAPDMTGSEQFAAVDALKESATFVYLRNPFGQVWAVSLNDISVDRMAGVGSREFGDLTIPYDEVTVN